MVDSDEDLVEWRYSFDKELEEHFQKFVADYEYIPDSDYIYIYLALYLVEKGRIGDFECLYKHHPNLCAQPWYNWDEDDVDEFNDVIYYTIVHNLYNIFKYCNDILETDMDYTAIIIKYKRLNFLDIIIKDIISSNTSYYKLNLKVVHRCFLKSDRTWYEGEELIYSYTNDHDYHDEFFRSYTGYVNVYL